jgi:YVTN family beta-propeller protein
MVWLMVLLHTAADCQAQVAPRKTLLALSKADHTLAIVDPATLQILTRIPVGEDPHEIIASPDGQTAYVSIYGGGSFHQLDVIDLMAQKPLVTVDTRPLVGPHGIVFASGKVWFTAEGSKSVGRYDPATGKLDWSLGTGQSRTHMLCVTADGKKIYTTNMASGTISVLSDTLLPPGPSSPATARPRQEWSHTVIPVSRGSEGLDVSPDGRWLWTAANEDGVVSIVDLRTHAVAARLDAKAVGANRVKFTPDGKRVFISSLSTGEVIVFDTQSRTEVKRVKAGRGASGMLMDPDGSRVFVACSPDNYVAIIDLKTLNVTGRIDVGKSPDGLAWAIRP